MPSKNNKIKINAPRVVELFGKVLGHALNRRIGFRVLQPLLATLVTLCYTAILFSQSLALTIGVVSAPVQSY